MSSPDQKSLNIQSDAAPVFKFIELSVDLLINVIKFLPPCDIVSVRQTCRRLLSVTRLRTVWVNALHGVMQDYSITEDTFPLQTMSVPLLEHSALSPYRLVSLLERSDNSRIEPASIRVLSPRLTNQEKAFHGILHSGELYDMFLAPGGRYLSTVAHYGGVSSILTVWDLGHSGNDGVKALTRLVQPMTPHCSLINFFPDLPRRGIFYLVSKREAHSPQGIVVDVHTITISPAFSTFVSVSKIWIPAMGPTDYYDVFASPELQRITVRTDDTVKNRFLIWDFIHNTAAAWIAPDCPIRPELVFFSYKDSLVVGVRDKVLIYNIPPFVPFDSEIAPRHLEASLSLSSPFPTPGFFFICQDCRPSSQASQYICAANSEKIAVYKVNNTHSSGNPAVPNKLPTIAASVNAAYPSFAVDNIDSFTRMEHSIGHLFLGCSNDELGTFKVYMFKIADRPNRQWNIKPSWASLFYDPTMALHRSQFYPLTGRMCLLTQNRKLHILDFLVPPD
ncbi:hypothetical protein GALMADRAFT_241908 [Galerina marginata CBS 339.88]|uniref:F-box domain-containing protein n=1 Tax=Galerina marginata (strain CBS 339.88) TaxID=685588 RepID=A0A067TLH0_GALM3|nr:hypothetical protein GALMADRAFT_241908 [Galerina marginata CBS 339.88]